MCGGGDNVRLNHRNRHNIARGGQSRGEEQVVDVTNGSESHTHAHTHTHTHTHTRTHIHTHTHTISTRRRAHRPDGGWG